MPNAIQMLQLEYEAREKKFRNGEKSAPSLFRAFANALAGMINPTATMTEAQAQFVIDIITGDWMLRTITPSAREQMELAGFINKCDDRPA